jgi:hypothetical protein
MQPTTACLTTSGFVYSVLARLAENWQKGMAGPHCLPVTVVACHPGNRRPDPAAYVAASAVDPAQTASSGRASTRH